MKISVQHEKNAFGDSLSKENLQFNEFCKKLFVYSLCVDHCAIYNRNLTMSNRKVHVRDPQSSVLVACQMLWFARKQGKILTPMQLLKLVYISHGWMLALHGLSLFCESVEAWRYGPVEPNVYNAFKKFGGNQITEPIKDYSDRFDEYELDIMEQVVGAYCDYTGIQLSGLTHQVGSPWDTTIKMLGYNSIIPNDLIRQYYRNLLPTTQA